MSSHEKERIQRLKIFIIRRDSYRWLQIKISA